MRNPTDDLNFQQTLRIAKKNSDFIAAGTGICFLIIQPMDVFSYILFFIFLASYGYTIREGREERRREVMDTRKVNPSQYLNAEDVLVKDTLTIKNVTLENFGREGQNPEQKLTVGFEETEKRWPLNRENKKAMEAKFGYESDEWIGKRITIVRLMVKGYSGGMVPGLRLAA